MTLLPVCQIGQKMQEFLMKFLNALHCFPTHKCNFGKAVVIYLGKQVGQGCVCPVAAKVKAILDFPAPQTHLELRHILGMAGYYCAFSKNFSQIVAQLNSL